MTWHLFLVAIVLLFFKRNKNQLQKKKLKEPDYALIAFGSAFPSYSVRKSKTEGFDRLEMVTCLDTYRD